MSQRAILTFCLILLAVSWTNGMPLSRTVRCTCIKIHNKSVNPRLLEKLEIIPANQFCPLEIIATMKKSGERRCLNPELKAIKNLLKTVRKERSKRSQTPREAQSPQ
ncbi:C-X-C motif chemokine 10 [Ochotona curzoniae]|uniref:C-X-C motif chemokine 10 n=1 Tax=Ochotona curzoniae TaxID=130825 RepID=UPI001B34E921|nr:C-X-C motif chemokine 10 [Ochotona curzoniae]